MPAAYVICPIIKALFGLGRQTIISACDTIFNEHGDCDIKGIIDQILTKYSVNAFIRDWCAKTC